MGILIEELRVRNYKCYQNVDVKLNESALLLGANNVGKTSLLEALELCFTQYKRISEELIFVKKDEPLKKDTIIILDVLISSEEEKFEDKWFELFGAFIIEDQFEDKEVVALRTIIKYNFLKGEYDLDRKAMNIWPKSEDVLTFENFSTHRVTREIIESIPVFYLDAKRDIASEMGDKFSYWGKLVKDINLSDKDLEEMEKHLNEINNNIISNSDVLKHLSESLNKITEVMDSGRKSVEINPVSRKIKDLNKGMEIRFNDRESESFSIANQGMGTRSWTTFLTLSAYIEWKIKQTREEDKPFHPLLLLEEPESHLHPQAQRKIYSQMKELKGQKIISTHSPIIAAQVDLEEIIHVYKKSATSAVNSLSLEELSPNDVRKIKEEVIKTRGDILFADTLILCEGETEDQVIPILFKEYFGREPFELGVNVVSVGGSGKYKPFMRVARDLDIDLFILSDGEHTTIKDVTKHYNEVFTGVEGYDLNERIKFLPKEADFEEYLVSDGYSPELINILDLVKGQDNFLDKFIEKNHGNLGRPRRTDDVCAECNQNIFIQETKDFAGEDGITSALIECLTSIKTEYSALIGQEILKREGIDKIPTALRELFSEIARIKLYNVNSLFASIPKEREYAKVNK